MKRKITIVSFLLLAITVAASSAFGRAVENWSYERLSKESDLVVIAQPIQSEDSPDRTKDNLWKIEFTGINTKFDVLHDLKGKCKSANLTVLHFRANVRIINGPCFVTFRTKELRYTIEKEGHLGTKVSVAGPATYLLFLKKRDDGRYEPTSGHIDPALSVRELRMSTPFEKEE